MINAAVLTISDSVSAGARQELFISTDWNQEQVEDAFRKAGAEVG